MIDGKFNKCYYLSQAKRRKNQVQTFYFDSFDGKKIFVREWAPVGHPIGIVQIFHGMAEHGGRYDDLGKYLSDKGYLVFADDHRAHGNTDKNNLGYCDGDIWNDTLVDLQALNAHYRKKYSNVKYVILGHSYGSFLLQRYMQIANDDLFDGVILSGSAQMQGPQVSMGKLIATMGEPSAPCNVAKKLSFDAYNKKFKTGDFISSIPEESARYAQDSDCGFVCSNNFYKCFFGGLQGLYSKKNLAKIDILKPILLMSGDKDPVGDFGRSVSKLYETYKKRGVLNLYFRLFVNNRHEVFNDVSSAEAKKLVCDFFSMVK